MRRLLRILLVLFIAFYVAATIGFIWFVGRETTFERSDGSTPIVPSTVTTGNLAPKPEGKNTVLWISLDGFREDYPSLANTPTLDHLAKTAAWTREYVPTFPSITFPSHASTCTGQPASVHGVTANTFYDKEDQSLYRFPSGPHLLQAEAIWTTATRQGIPTCVHDWPFSQGQSGKWKAAAFQEKFEVKLRADERFSALSEAYRSSADKKPYRLLMGYAAEADKAGHEYGPTAPETLATVEKLDADIKVLLQDIIAQFDATMNSGDELYFLLTTDHGMADVEFNINIDSVLGPSLETNLEIAKSGNIANLFVIPSPTIGTPDSIIEGCEKAFEEFEFAKTYRRDALPSDWSYAHPTRTGDLVVVLEKGYTFNSTMLRKVYPTNESTLQGMHGYPPETTPEMWGFSLFWRYPTPLEKTGNLGRVNALQIYPTVCNLLGIDPVKEATGTPLQIR